MKTKRRMEGTLWDCRILVCITHERVSSSLTVELRELLCITYQYLEQMLNKINFFLVPSLAAKFLRTNYCLILPRRSEILFLPDDSTPFPVFFKKQGKIFFAKYWNHLMAAFSHNSSFFSSANFKNFSFPPEYLTWFCSIEIGQKSPKIAFLVMEIFESHDQHILTFK